MPTLTNKTAWIAAMQVACEWVVANPDAMRQIARACRAQPYQITGPAVDAIASMLARALDPAANVALIADYCRRALRPRGPTIDPQTLEAHGGAGVQMDVYTAVLYSAPDVLKRHKKRAAVPIDAGQDHSKPDHRQKQKRAAALRAGQLFFCGFDWRCAANDEDMAPLGGEVA